MMNIIKWPIIIGFVYRYVEMVELVWSNLEKV